jgi:MFS family permease
MVVVDPPAVRARRPLVGLLVAHGVSLTGNVLTLIALPLYVLAQTGSPALTGLTGAVATLPVILGGALGGVFVDRLGYRRTSVVADLIGAVTIGAVPLIDQTVDLPLWALLALVFATGLLDTPGQVARNALLPEAATSAGVPLERAVGWFEAIERGARLVGAPLAGLLVAVVGAPGTLALDAATFLAAALTVLWLLPAAPRIATGAIVHDPEREGDPAQAAPAPRTGYWSELADGVRFLLHEPLLRAVILLVLCTNVLDAAKTSVLLPVAAERQLGGPIAYGLLVGTMAGGALAGSLLFSAVGHRLPRRAIFVTAFTLAGAPPLLALALDLPLPLLVAITATAGLAAGAINPIIGTLKLERVPPGMRARVYGVMGAGTWAGMPLGSLAAGLATEHIGLTATLTTAGATYLLLTLTPLLGGSWKHMSAPQSSPGSDRCSV